MIARPQSSLPVEAYQSYLRGLRAVWKDDLYRRVIRQAALADATDPVDLERRLASDPDYRLYGWLERHLQQFKYFGRWGMAPVAGAQAPDLTAALDAAARQHPERLRLRPDLPLPDYYVDADFHQHRGGIWSDDVDAFVYEWAADRFSFALQDSTAPYDAFARHIMTGFRPSRVLDLGCGFGKSTLPFKKIAPEAQVCGIDLSAPCLRLAHLRALESDLDIVFEQASAEALPFADGSFDAVACYWLLHELPWSSALETMKEAFRVLRPGGVFASRDMHTSIGGVIGAFLNAGHAARNQEPFMLDLIPDRLRQALHDVGFVDISFHPTDSAVPGLAPDEPLPPSRLHVNTILQARRP